MKPIPSDDMMKSDLLKVSINKEKFSQYLTERRHERNEKEKEEIARKRYNLFQKKIQDLGMEEERVDD